MLRVAAALRTLGWPTPEPVEEPFLAPDGVWLLFGRLPGEPVRRAGPDGPAEQRARGRLLAELHAAAVATGIVEQRAGFTSPEQVVADPELERWLRVHERACPDEGRLLWAARDAAATWFADHPDVGAPRSVIHGDFAPWNLLYERGRLTGVLDFEASHYAFQVADFVLSWRGYQDDVLRGYDEVRPLSDLEWHLVRPVYWAWMFLDAKEVLRAHYAGDGRKPAFDWQIAHLRKHSELLTRKADWPGLPVGP
jgi:Ser/Thr protein kinase RdoA (MazF antagonist)